MKAKVLFFDDIFSDLFRRDLPADQLVWDDNWVAALEQGLTESDQRTGFIFDLVKSGNIESCIDQIKVEKPDIVMIDLFWPAEAAAKYGDRNLGSNISFDAMKLIRQEFPELPIICYTLKPDKEVMDKAYQSGATIFLEKISLALAEVQSPLKYILIYLLKNKS